MKRWLMIFLGLLMALGIFTISGLLARALRDWLA